MRENIIENEDQEIVYYEVDISEVIHTRRRLRISELIRRGKILRRHASE